MYLFNKNSRRFLEQSAKITSFSECIFRVYLISWWNQRMPLYLIWKSIICSTESLLNHPYIYFLKGKIHVLNLKRISVIRIDSLLILCISKLITVKAFVVTPQNDKKIHNFQRGVTTKAIKFFLLMKFFLNPNLFAWILIYFNKKHTFSVNYLKM